MILKQISIFDVMFTTAFLALLGRAGYVDFRERRIPDRCTAGLFAIAVSAAVFCNGPPFADRLLGLAAVSVPMLALTLFVPGAFGGGDIKLMAASGLFLGAGTELSAFFYALCGGGIYSLYLVFCKSKSKKEEFAFGPFLVLGIYLALIFPVF